MAINPDSVIPIWINDWNPGFYTKLTTQENISYTTGTGLNTKANWTSAFTSLAGALTSWKETSRQSLLNSLVPSMYSYEVLHILYGTSDSLNSSLAVDSLFDINGYIAATLSRPDDYYMDMATVSMETSSAKMTADLATVGGAVEAESTAATSLQSQIQSVVSSQVNKNLFEDQELIGNFPGKAGMADLIFNTLGYKKVYEVLNVGSLVLPPSIN